MLEFQARVSVRAPPYREVADEGLELRADGRPLDEVRDVGRGRCRLTILKKPRGLKEDVLSFKELKPGAFKLKPQHGSLKLRVNLHCLAARSCAASGESLAALYAPGLKSAVCATRLMCACERPRTNIYPREFLVTNSQ